MRTAVSPPADIAERISAVEYEIRALENSGPPLTERLAAAEAELAQCEAHFRRHGFTPVGALPSERAHYGAMALRGALMVAAADAILATERERIKRAHRESGGFGYSVEEKAERLAELRAALRPLYAVREAGWRAAERDGRPVDRSAGLDPETFLASDHDLAALAADRESAREATA